jgi:hypothetical protein
MVLVLEKHDVDAVRRIVEAAAMAPSAENTQPWRFVPEGSSLLVCLETARTLASDVSSMLSLTAIGAAIENAVIASSAEGRCADVELVSDTIPPRPQCATIPIARIHFCDGAQRDPLADDIKSRVTTRRMDHRRPIDRAPLCVLERSCEGFPGVSIHWVDNSRLGEFARLIGIGNRIRFEHKSFHREFYDNLRFTAAEARRARDGLDLTTLQLPHGVATILRILRTWPRMKLANILGFSRGVARQAAREVRRSGAVGFLTVESPGLPEFIDGGRAFERLWLAASSLGLRVHPTASLPVFMAHARSGLEDLLPRHARLATTMTKQFYQLWPDLTGRVVQIAFRLGFGSLPRTRSLRRTLEAVLGCD